MDAEAQAMYRRAGVDPAEPIGMLTLARFLLGCDAVVEHTGLRRQPAVYVRTLGQLWVRPGLAPRRLGYCIAHELGEWWLGELGYDAADREDACDSLAAALLLPREAFRSGVRHHGRSLPTLADAFCTTQSVVALRLGEVTGSPLALVTPRRVHVRGDPWAWPSEGVLRDMVASEAMPPELERLPVTDAPRRVALAAVG